MCQHDLWNPRGVAEGSLELAQEVCESDREASDAVRRSQALVDALLTLVCGEGDVGDTEAIGLVEVAEASWQPVDTGQATLKIDTTGTVEADRSRLQQLLETLYQNSAVDTGPGVPEAHRERVFEAGYSRTEDSTKFGVRVVKQVTGAHGWWVTSTESEQGDARLELTGVESGRR